MVLLLGPPGTSCVAGENLSTSIPPCFPMLSPPLSPPCHPHKGWLAPLCPVEFCKQPSASTLPSFPRYVLRVPAQGCNRGDRRALSLLPQHMTAQEEEGHPEMAQAEEQTPLPHTPTTLKGNYLYKVEQLH